MTFNFPTPDQTNWKLICDNVKVGETCYVSYDNFDGYDTITRLDDFEIKVTSPGYPNCSVSLNDSYEMQSSGT